MRPDHRGAWQGRPPPYGPWPRRRSPVRNGRWRPPALRSPRLGHAGHEIVEAADATGGDDRHRDRVADRPREGEIVAGACPVLVHGGDQQFTRALAGDQSGEGDGIDPRRVAAAMGEDVPGSGRPGRRDALGVDRHHDALGAEFFRRSGDEVRILHGRGVDRDLVGPGEQQGPDILDRADAAADGERHEASLGGPADDVEQRAAGFAARGDVEEAQLVGAGRVVDLGGLDGVAGIAQALEAHALHDAPVLHVEAGDDASLEQGRLFSPKCLLDRLRRVASATLLASKDIPLGTASKASPSRRPPLPAHLGKRAPKAWTRRLLSPGLSSSTSAALFRCVRIETVQLRLRRSGW